MTFWASQSKDRAYVTNVVSWYRQELDRALEKRGWDRTSSGHSRVDFAPDPSKTFNRDFTPHFLQGRREPPGAIDSPKMVGEYAGTVTAVKGCYFVLDASVALHSGDGLCWFDARHELQGTFVNAAQPGRGGSQVRVTPEKMSGIRPGLKVYRNHDHAFLRQVERSRPVRRIAVRLRLEDTPEGLVLHAGDEDGNTATGTLPMAKEAAHKPDKAETTTRKQLAKMGNTPFACDSVELAWEQVYFVPVAALNTLRRQTLAWLAAVRVANHPRLEGGIVPNEAPYPETTLTYRGNALNQKAVDFYRRHGVTKIAPAAESGLDLEGQVVMRTRHCIQHQLGLCDGTRTASRLQGPLYLVDPDGHRYRLRFDCAACEMDIIY